MGVPSRLRFWAWPWELRRCGVLGINARNLNYMARLNPRKFYPPPQALLRLVVL